ncbi:peptide chain release factor N(5)-glutamine methyltransferase [candidate division WWE3 bacterium]|uniref:Peptide chain release factor N(5)-glutamine methyltransferase n=1 Tax=candidate division WWE3 bacterium TaxID=2053526 RepID=A0A955LG78_UNCKA|nr:peptide chain release factor N(5)-glutamine methyltransferase [candidate division WWE3 bacterium]
MSERILSEFEIRHLQKHGISIDDIDHYAEMPVEYITGIAEFYGRDFFVSPATLIPREESEKMIDLVLQEVAVENKPLCIMDVGTGSGSIGLSIFLELLDRKIISRLILRDISSEALEIARENIQTLVPAELAKCITLEEKSLLENLSEVPDILVANLPYVPSGRIETLPEPVVDYEPLLALDGGEDGSHLINMLLSQLGDLSSKPRMIILEIDETHTIEKFAIPQIFTAQIITDTYGKNRFLILR